MKVRKGRCIAMLVIAVLAVGMEFGATKPLADHDEIRFSTRHQRTIELRPSGITFRVPPDWLKWNAQFHNNLHLTRQELKGVETGKGEWDSEYATVVNSALPFDDCAAHVGGEGWGLQSASFGDLQMRAYVTHLSAREILERIQGPGFGHAASIAKLKGGRTGSEAHIAVKTAGDWQRATIEYPLWYGDYGGLAMVDFYVREVRSYRLVLVFMGGSGNPGEKRSILQSVVVKE